MAGKITHAFFDKTGTLTTDSLISKGVISNTAPDAAAPSTNGGGGGGGGAPALRASTAASAEVAAVIGGCHALLQVDGQLHTDPDPNFSLI